MIDVYKYHGKTVKLVSITGKTYSGEASAGYDDEKDEDYLDIEYPGKHIVYEIMASEIKSIEIVEE